MLAPDLAATRTSLPRGRWALPCGLALLLASTVLAGCGSVSLGTTSEADLRREIRARGVDPATILLPFEPTPEMRAWAHAQLPKQKLDDEERLRVLLAAMLDPTRLGLTYEGQYTATAAEAFTRRKANCLAFTSLFVGLGREVGVPVFYLDVDDVLRFEKDGDLVVVSGHVSAGFEVGPVLKALDFTAAPDSKHHEVHPISDLRAVALYYSNRGGELLRTGKEREALPWLQNAVALDPELARGWVNLGVGLRRNGDVVAAEAAYRKALEIDPSATSAYQNLASLLRLRGQAEEAEQLMRLTERLGSRNPFNYLDLGDLSLVHGRLEEARRFYKKALRLYGDNAEPYAAMGLWAVAAGDSGSARKWLRKAAAIDGENARVKRLQAQLQAAPAPGAPLGTR